MPTVFTLEEKKTIVKLDCANSEAYAYGVYMTGSNNRFSNNTISETVSIYGGESVYALWNAR